jgi:hypothetical protein
MKKIIVGLILVFFVTSCASVEFYDESEQFQESSPITGAAVVKDNNAANNDISSAKFNVEIDLPKTYRDISPGDELWFTTKLLNLANQERIDVTLQYHILDGARDLMFSKSETVAVETQASFVANLQSPKTLKPGLHFLEVLLDSPFGQSTSETSFMVSPADQDKQIVIKLSLFDIQVEIPDAYKEIHPGDQLLTSIKLINVGTEGRIDIFLDYWITDKDGNKIMKETETVAVETQNNFVRIFEIPKDTSAGDYTFHAKLSYPGLELEPEYATSFLVVKKKLPISHYIIGGIGLLFLFWLILHFTFLRNVIEKKKIENKVKKVVKKKK